MLVFPLLFSTCPHFAKFSLYSLATVALIAPKKWIGSMKYKKTVSTSIALLLFVAGCSTPRDVAKSPPIATISSRGDITLATHCVRKQKEAQGTMVNSVMNFDVFPTPTGSEMQLFAQGDHRITYAIAYYTKTSKGYSVEVRATGQQWGSELVKWVSSCATPG